MTKRMMNGAVALYRVIVSGLGCAAFSKAAETISSPIVLVACAAEAPLCALWLWVILGQEFGLMAIMGGVIILIPVLWLLLRNYRGEGCNNCQSFKVMLFEYSIASFSSIAKTNSLRRRHFFASFSSRRKFSILIAGQKAFPSNHRICPPACIIKAAPAAISQMLPCEAEATHLPLRTEAIENTVDPKQYRRIEP